jgi:uncharacterized delta-60 repeat protein
MRNLHPAHAVRKRNTIDRLNRAAFEVLEDRRLLAAVTGTVFDDLDKDGVHDAGEPGRADQLVYADLDGDGTHDTNVFTYNSVYQPPKAITDDPAQTTDFTLNVPSIGSVADLDVTLDITHPYAGDLRVVLISPNGTTVELFDTVGGAGDNFTNTVLDHQATTPIAAGDAPFTGRFKPSGLLTAFNGQQAGGTWILRIQDQATDDAGFVNRWGLTVTTVGGANEPGTRTDSAGNYSLTLPAAGTYTIRDQLSAGRTRTAPATGAHSVTLTATETRADVDFGSYRTDFQGAGLLDPTFGTNGVLTFPTTGLEQGGRALAVQSDGKILVGGWTFDPANAASGRSFYVARMNPADGSLDSSFNGTGYVITHFEREGAANLDDEVSDLIIQSDGKIIAAGRAGGSIGDFAFARYNTDGTLDTSFSGDGKLTVDLNPGLGDAVAGLALQSDGKIVATGTATTPGSTNFGTVRLNANGTLDDTFGNGGIVVTDFLGGNDAASDVIVDKDGNVVVIGGATPFATGGGGYRRWVMARYTPAGTLDTTFDGGGDFSGKVSHDFQVAATAETIVQQSDGKYLIGGLIDDQWTLARFENDGSLDATFGSGGKTTVPGLVGDPLADYGMAVQSDGKIVLGGHHVSDSGADAFFAATRFLPDGTLDLNFGSDGVAITAAPGDASGSDLVLQRDGKILLVGGNGVLTLVRYENDLPDAPTFAVLGADGVLTVTGTDGDDQLQISASGGTVTAQLGGETATFQSGQVTSINVLGLGGNDTLTAALAETIPATFDGGAGNNTLDVNAGTWTFAADANGLNVTADNDAVVTFQASQNLAALNLLGNAVATLTADGSKFLRTGAIAMSPTSKLDLQNNNMIIDATAETRDAVHAAVRGLVAAARNASTRWGGPGITSSSAAARPVTTLAAMVNPGLETLSGQPVDADDVLVKYTYNGDASLDGRINADDYFRIDQGFLTQPANPSYRQGDFNYDGRVNADDYFLIDQGFLGQGAPLSAQPPTALSASLSATAADAATSFTVTSSQEEASKPKKTARKASDDAVLSHRTQRRAATPRRR